MKQSDILDLLEVTEIDIIYRNPVRPADRPIISDAEDAFHLLKRVWDMNKIELVEQFKIILLTRGHACLGISDIGLGGMSGVIADPKIIFSTALKAGASSIILAHNHPSGQLKPSRDDISLTANIREIGNALQLPVTDHLIINADQYYSFADKGLVL